MSKKGLIIPIIMLLIGLVLVITIVISMGGTGEVSNGTPRDMEYFEINGMPCLYYNGYEKAGLTCDWDEWKGVGQ